MALAPGARLGPYEILSPLGAGGMGEVYRARDTKLNRDVALKVLPDSFANDPDRLARFQREAQVLASLNHPHIAQIYGLEESGGVRALVMELVDGEDLSQRIARGPIPLDEALPIAKQIADALEAAHEQGIIHRDLKPANIKVRPDGTVKVLDFGLAKLTEPGSAGRAGALHLTQSPTITSPVQLTGMSVILGTAAYMSPEQAKGRATDRRTDIWSFGVVLFEMLTARRAFEGETISDVLAKVIEREPDWRTLPSATSAPIRELLRRCLKKDPKARLRDAGDARVQIDEALSSAPGDGDANVTADAVSTWRRALPWMVVAGSLLVTVPALTLWVPWRTMTPRIERFSILPPGKEVLAIDNFNPDVALSPDGTRIVFATGVQPNYHWYVRQLDTLIATPLPTMPPDAENPFVSPDNTWLGFSDEGARRLMKVPIVGGPVVMICEVPGASMRGASWGPDDTIVFGTSGPSGLWRVSAQGGKPEALTTSENRSSHVWPKFLPGGRAVLFTIVPAGANVVNAQVAVVNLTTGAQTVLISGGSYARYSPTGHVIYGVGGTLQAVGFDLNRLAVTTAPLPVVDGIVTKSSSGVADFDLGNDGSLVFIAGEVHAEHTLAWVDRKGREEPINAPPRAYVYARLSPDGTRIALDVREEQSDVWIWDIARQTLQPLTNDPGLNRLPIWTPDGKRVAFSAEREGLESVYWQAFDGSGTMERLSSGARTEGTQSFSPDSAQLIFSTPMSAPFDLGVISLGANRTSRMLLHSKANETNAEISPDGHWLAYQSDESHRDEVYVSPFPNVETGKRLVSTSGGTRPLWSRDRKELFYFAGDTIMSVPVLDAEMKLGIPQSIVKGIAAPLYSGRHYDASADGQRFLLIKDTPTADGHNTAVPEIRLVLNWAEELKAKVAVRK